MPPFAGHVMASLDQLTLHDNATADARAEDNAEHDRCMARGAVARFR